jgi:hypothetical protein
MNVDDFIGGVALFAFGLVALLEKNFEGAIFLMALGLGFMAAGLGRRESTSLFKFFFGIFSKTLGRL